MDIQVGSMGQLIHRVSWEDNPLILTFYPNFKRGTSKDQGPDSSWYRWGNSNFQQIDVSKRSLFFLRILQHTLGTYPRPRSPTLYVWEFPNRLGVSLGMPGVWWYVGILLDSFKPTNL